MLIAPLAVLGLLASPVAAPSPSCLLPPVTAAIVDPFREPPCEWCPGNRGITYATPGGATVRAAAAGVVTFSGVVAGTRYVVVEHADGRRATYGELVDTRLERGQAIAAGSVVGHSGALLHFGVRAGDDYLDPAPLLGRLVERPRLVPTDGTAARPAPPPRLRCGPAPPG